MRVGTAGLTIVAALASGGCYISSTGSADRLAQSPQLIPAAYWPTPPVRQLDETLFAYPDTQPLRPITPGVRPQSSKGSRTETLRIHRSQGTIVKLIVDDQGRPAESPPDLLSLFIGFSPNGYAQTGLTFGTVNEHVTALIRERTRLASLQSPPARGTVSPQPPQPFCAPAVIVEERAGYSTGIAFKFPTFLPPSPRGVILHLWALGSNPYEREVIDEFRRRGWIVVDIDPDDGIDPDIDESVVARVLELEEQRDLANKLLKPLPTTGTFEERARRGGATRSTRISTV